MSYFYRPSLITVRSVDYQNGADLILSDHGRSELEVTVERIENRERMASGRMRSRHIADKHKFSTSWDMLPSRSNFTADRYASAIDIKDFYDSVKGEFSITLFADADTTPSLTPSGVFGSYNVFFSSFSASVVKRGKDFDFWNISFEVEQA